MHNGTAKLLTHVYLQNKGRLRPMPKRPLRSLAYANITQLYNSLAATLCRSDQLSKADSDLPAAQRGTKHPEAAGHHGPRSWLGNGSNRIRGNGQGEGYRVRIAQTERTDRKPSRSTRRPSQKRRERRKIRPTVEG